MTDYILEQAYCALYAVEKLIGYIEDENGRAEYNRSQFKLLSFQPARQADNATEPRKKKEESERAEKEERGINKKSAETKTIEEAKEMIRFSDCTVRRRKNGLYEIRYRRGGIEKTWSSMKLKKAKQKCMAWLHSENRQRRELAAEGLPPETVIFGPFADNYMYNVKKRMVKEETFVSYLNTYKRHILPNFGKLPLAGIKAVFIQKILNELNEKIPRACEDVKVLLNSIFTYAVNNGEIKINPIKAVYIPKHERETGKALTKEEETRLLEKLKGKKIELAYILALYTGMRGCEVNSAVFDVEKNTITIKNGKLKSYQKEKFRTIPIFPKLKPYIPRFMSEEWKMHPNKISRVLSQLLPTHTFKDLRHTFTTRARECGIENEVVSLWTGHSLGNITASVYTHFSPEFMQQEAEKLRY